MPSPCNSSHRFVFIRHAEAVCNVQADTAMLGLFDPHSPLTDVGKQQARQLAEALPQALIGKQIFCSPQRRAIDTATNLAARHGLRIMSDSRLEELRVNCPFPAPMTVNAWDALLEKRVSTPAEVVQPGIESLAAQRARLVDFLQQRHEQRGLEQVTLVVSHAYTIELAIHHLLGLGLAAFKQFRLRISHAAVHVVENERLGSTSRLVLTNGKHHLGNLL